jgi:hypothetical protein
LLLQLIRRFFISFSSLEDFAVREETTIKARGLPWHCTEFDILKFFAGLNIAE